MEPPSAGRQLVVNDSYFCAESADKNGCVNQRNIHPKSMQHSEDLLRFPQGKDRNQTDPPRSKAARIASRNLSSSFSRENLGSAARSPRVVSMIRTSKGSSGKVALGTRL